MNKANDWMTWTDEEIKNVEKCYCPCHKHPGTYSSPCGYCGHENKEGQMIGGIVYGFWVGHRWELTIEEQEELKNR